MPIQLDFEWQRDRAGYELAEPNENSEWNRMLASDMIKRELGLPADSFPRHQIRRCGGELVPSWPLEQTDNLFMVFVGAARTAEGLLDFVDRYGPLTRSGNGAEGEDVRFGMGWARFMDDLLRSPPNERMASLRRRPNGGLLCSNSNIWLVADPISGSAQLKFRLDTLLEALVLQFAQAVAGGHDMHPCAFCGRWFDVGPGSGRRADAKFCSDEHRIVFNSRKRRKEQS